MRSLEKKNEEVRMKVYIKGFAEAVNIKVKSLCEYLVNKSRHLRCVNTNVS